jgi:hypothetical protein
MKTLVFGDRMDRLKSSLDPWSTSQKKKITLLFIWEIKQKEGGSLCCPELSTGNKTCVQII